MGLQEAVVVQIVHKASNVFVNYFSVFAFPKQFGIYNFLSLEKIALLHFNEVLAMWIKLIHRINDTYMRPI